MREPTLKPTDRVIKIGGFFSFSLFALQTSYLENFPSFLEAFFRIYNLQFTPRFRPIFEGWNSGRVMILPVHFPPSTSPDEISSFCFSFCVFANALPPLPPPLLHPSPLRFPSLPRPIWPNAREKKKKRERKFRKRDGGGEGGGGEKRRREKRRDVLILTRLFSRWPSFALEQIWKGRREEVRKQVDQVSSCISPVFPPCDERATDARGDPSRRDRSICLRNGTWDDIVDGTRKVAYIIGHPAPTINGTHYVRNRRSAGALFVLFERRFLGACRAASWHSSTPDR